MTFVVLLAFAALLIFVLPEVLAATLVPLLAFGGSFVWCRHRLLRRAAHEKIRQVAGR